MRGKHDGQEAGRRVHRHVHSGLRRVRHRCPRGGWSGEKNIGVGWLGVAIAFGLTVVVGAYALAAISGAHFNPAVTLGLWAGKRFEAKGILPYIAVQVVAAIAAAGVLLLIARDGQGFSLDGGFASNGYGAHSPGNYGIAAAILAEFVLTFIFIFVIMGTTDERAPKGFAPLAIGLCLTLVHLVGIPVTNMSVNPARSIGPAVFVGGGRSSSFGCSSWSPSWEGSLPVLPTGSCLGRVRRTSWAPPDQVPSERGRAARIPNRPLPVGRAGRRRFASCLAHSRQSHPRCLTCLRNDAYLGTRRRIRTLSHVEESGNRSWWCDPPKTNNVRSRHVWGRCYRATRSAGSRSSCRHADQYGER